MSDPVREKLREFYQKAHAESLSVRKTATNYLLVEKKEGKGKALAKFSIAGLGEGVALVLANDARDKAIRLKADYEMGILEGSVAKPPKDIFTTPKAISEFERAVARAVRPASEGSMGQAPMLEMIQERGIVSEKDLESSNPLSQFVPDMFNRTASIEKPLE